MTNFFFFLLFFLKKKGTYKSGEPIVMISSFVPTVNVITSKQRPRKLTIKGGDGKDYQFLLKGHEDLRQDERVMQLFGLVNTLLETDPETFKRHLRFFFLIFLIFFFSKFF